MVAGGSLIVSGLLAAERADVVAALERAADLRVAWESEEDGWVALLFKSQGASLKCQT
jgi:ribosomal protein L11 methylase PrmA